MTDHTGGPADPAIAMTFEQALAAIDQRPGPGMDLVAATAVLAGTAPDKAQAATRDTLYDREPSEVLILHFVIDNAPPLPQSAVDNPHIMAQAHRATPEKLLRIISAHITQAQADEWLGRVEDLLLNYQRGVREAHKAMAITGDPKQAAALSARRIREDLRRSGRTIHPDTEKLLQKLEQLSRD